MTTANSLKLIFVISLLALMVCFISLEFGFAGEATTVRWIDVDQLNQVLKAQSPVIVDLRTPREFEQGHIAGAVNVPVDDLRANRTLLDAYKDKTVLLYCRTVNRTGRALGLIDGRGFKMIYALNGGYAAYRLKYP